MGDGQHIWAAAEWVLIIRNCFVREEETEGKLILCSGIPDSWIPEGSVISFGPTLTSFGPVKIQIKTESRKIKIQWSGGWYGGKEPLIEIRLPGRAKIKVPEGQTYIVLNNEPTRHPEGAKRPKDLDSSSPSAPQNDGSTKTL